MKQTDLTKNIKALDIKKETLSILNEHSVYEIKDLWILKRTDLKKMGLKDSEINNVIIKLQLFGIDINKKIYNKD